MVLNNDECVVLRESLERKCLIGLLL